MRKRIIILSTLLTLFGGLSLPATAQPGGGDRGGGRGDAGGGRGGSVEVPTITVPDVQITLPAADTSSLSIPSQEDLMLPESWSDFAMPDDWSEFALPAGMPTSTEELVAYWGTIDVPYELSFEDISLESLSFESAEEAAAVIVGFASNYLGTAVATLYAGSADSNTVDQYDDLINQVLALFPEDVQAILNSAATISGTSYWALLSDGAGIVYTGDCSSSACSVDMESLQFQITNSSLGAYALYRSSFVTDSNAAMALVMNMYPALANQSWTEVANDYGYAFVSTGYTSSTVVVYYAGVIEAAGQSLVYAVVGIGEGYAQVVRG